MLLTHGTDKLACPAKRKVLDKKQDGQNKAKDEEDKEVTAGGKSCKDDSQKDVIIGAYEEKDKNSHGNYSEISLSSKQNGLDDIQELVDNGEAQEKEKPRIILLLI